MKNWSPPNYTHLFRDFGTVTTPLVSVASTHRIKTSWPNKKSKKKGGGGKKNESKNHCRGSKIMKYIN